MRWSLGLVVLLVCGTSDSQTTYDQEGNTAYQEYLKTAEERVAAALDPCIDLMSPDWKQVYDTYYDTPEMNEAIRILPARTLRLQMKLLKLAYVFLPYLTSKEAELASSPELECWTELFTIHEALGLTPVLGDDVDPQNVDTLLREVYSGRNQESNAVLQLRYVAYDVFHHTAYLDYVRKNHPTNYIAVAAHTTLHWIGVLWYVGNFRHGATMDTESVTHRHTAEVLLDSFKPYLLPYEATASWPGFLWYLSRHPVATRRFGEVGVALKDVSLSDILLLASETLPEPNYKTELEQARLLWRTAKQHRDGSLLRGFTTTRKTCRGVKSGGGRVVVVGGGVSGVAAATALAANGVQVDLLDRHRELGGELRKSDSGSYAVFTEQPVQGFSAGSLTLDCQLQGSPAMCALPTDAASNGQVPTDSERTFFNVDAWHAAVNSLANVSVHLGRTVQKPQATDVKDGCLTSVVDQRGKVWEADYFVFTGSLVEVGRVMGLLGSETNVQRNRIWTVRCVGTNPAERSTATVLDTETFGSVHIVAKAGQTTLTLVTTKTTVYNTVEADALSAARVIIESLGHTLVSESCTVDPNTISIWSGSVGSEANSTYVEHVQIGNPTEKDTQYSNVFIAGAALGGLASSPPHVAGVETAVQSGQRAAAALLAEKARSDVLK